MAHRFLISQDSPVLFITVVTKDRLPVFRTDKLKDLVCLAIDEARRSAGFLLFAYVIMIDHMHLLASRPLNHIKCASCSQGNHRAANHRLLENQ